VTQTFIKPSGAEVNVNANSYDAAIALGWVPKDSIPVLVVEQAISENVVMIESAPKRRGRSPKINGG